MDELLITTTRFVIPIIDSMALLVIVFGTAEAFVSGVRMLFTSGSGHERRDIWLRYARWLVAGLTFQLAADILETSITTDWESVARLGLIAVIRTVLNYFLERDVEEVRVRQQGTRELASELRPKSETGA